MDGAWRHQLVIGARGTRFPTARRANYPEVPMASMLNGDGELPKSIGQRLSESFFRPSPPNSTKAAQAEAAQAMTPAERRAAMSGLDDNEMKWAKAGLILSTLLGGFLTYYLAAK